MSVKIAAPPAAGIRRPPGRRRRRFQPAVAFLLPSGLILGVFIIFPIFQSLWMSLHAWRIGAQSQPWVGLDNYRRLLADPQFANALRVTLVFTLVSVVVLLVLGFLVAYWLQRTTRFSKILRSAYFFPTVVALSVIGIVWRFMLDPDIGLVAGIWKTFGLEPVAWLRSPELALPTVIAVGIWKSLGFTMILLLAGLQGVPEHLYEAAKLDGAGPWQQVRHVTLPSIRPALLFAAVILTIQSLQAFDLIYAMTAGGPLFSTETLVTFMYRQSFQNFDFGYGSAIAWALFIVIMIISALQLRLFRYNDVD
ncbi:sugar ABC transporter permease [Actinotalea sp. M2MS4P-6]|uniref:carbohydrate ABC transporter permease n=1 Tax=Actinotalea sp. M2MS4P-6 TaxID=2983762 RepID=UPI0021E483C8|nr:sugar ABC transporter permease [Actinotalea sp. M2MS4P-6]MCV2394317.1 sugar ABC transporter permease [Actinotalea sp. M2MS4P-6]